MRNTPSIRPDGQSGRAFRTTLERGHGFIHRVIHFYGSRDTSDIKHLTDGLYRPGQFEMYTVISCQYFVYDDQRADANAGQRWGLTEINDQVAHPLVILLFGRLFQLLV